MGSNTHEGGDRLHPQLARNEICSASQPKDRTVADRSTWLVYLANWKLADDVFSAGENAEKGGQCEHNSNGDEQSTSKNPGEIGVIEVQMHVPANDHHKLEDHQYYQKANQRGMSNSGEKVERYFEAGHDCQNRSDHRVFARIGMGVFFVKVQFLTGHAWDPFVRYAD